MDGQTDVVTVAVLKTVERKSLEGSTPFPSVKERKQMSNKHGKEAIKFLNTLFFIFLVLKLCGVIKWSWWWVTAPLWMPLTSILAIALGLMGCALIIAIITTIIYGIAMGITVLIANITKKDKKG